MRRSMGRVAVLLLALVVMVGCSMVAVDARLGGGSASVNVYDQTGGSIRVHCQSRDDDLGDKWLANGQHTGWGFTPNFWGTTLYYCNFIWEGRKQGLDVYSEKHQCTHCVWQVRPDGFWWAEDGLDFAFAAPWK